MSTVLVALAAFVVMEPVTALTHRYVMHGIGWVLHRSHHAATAGRWEANDAFPVAFAAIVCIAMAIGFNVDGATVLVPAAIGVTAYGAAYALVHDGYIHRRFAVPDRPVVWLDKLASAHAVHHRHGGGPYGMLLPVVPRRARDQVGERVAPGPRA